jgi:inorganic pyrophosphatase
MKIANCKHVQLIQIFLPLYDNNKRGFDRALYDTLQTHLKDQFGGVTFYRNTPAEGLWEDETGKVNFDELIIAEVMIAEIDKEWWQQFKHRLEQIFGQEEILIRSIVFEKL